MKKYYLLENDLNIGPFTPEELKARNVIKSELVWSEGMDDWQQAGTIDELKSLFVVTPPPPPKITPPPPPSAAPPPPPKAAAAPPPPPVAPPPPTNQYQAPPPPQANHGNQTQFNQGEYVPKPGGTWIIVGYIFAVMGGLIGVAIGAHLKGGKEKLPNGAKVKKFDEKSQQHGLIILIIAVISSILLMSQM